jgi:hypothetical protein
MLRVGNAVVVDTVDRSALTDRAQSGVAARNMESSNAASIGETHEGFTEGWI